jgi:hypothetical protein
MRFLRKALVGTLFVASIITSVSAADVASLQIGDFTAISDGLATTESKFGSSDDKEQQLFLKINGFEVAANGKQTEAYSNFSGQFEVAQPESAPVKQMLIDVSGLVIKTPGSTAQIELKIGGVTKVVSWAETENVAQVFNETISADLPNGRLPAPFPVEAVATVKRPADGGSVLVSLKEIKVRMGGLATATID